MSRKQEDEERKKGAVPWLFGGSGRGGVELVGAALRARPALMGGRLASEGAHGSLLTRAGASLAAIMTPRAWVVGLAAVSAAALIGTGLWNGERRSQGSEGRKGLFGLGAASPRPEVRDARASSSLGMLQSANAGALSLGPAASSGAGKDSEAGSAVDFIDGEGEDEAAGQGKASETPAGAAGDAVETAGDVRDGVGALAPVPSMSERGGSGGWPAGPGTLSGGAGGSRASGAGDPAASARERPAPVPAAARPAPQAARRGDGFSARSAMGQLRAADGFSRAASGGTGEGASYTAAVPFDGGAAARGGSAAGVSGGGWSPGTGGDPSSSGGPFLQERPPTSSVPGGFSGSTGGIPGKNLTPYQPMVTLAVGLLAAASLLLLLAVILSRTIFGASWAQPIARAAAVLAAGAAAVGVYVMSLGQHLQGAVFTMAGAALAFLSWTAPLGDPNAAQGGQAAAGAAAAPAAQAADKLDASILSLPPGAG